MRDNKTCQLCGERIDSSLREYDPRCMSVDHIVPKSEGGPGIQTNLRATHRECNQRRHKHGRLDRSTRKDRKAKSPRKR